MPQKKILLIEDDGFLASIYAQKLEHEGFEVALAISGEDGIKLAQKDAPDLIALDLRLTAGKMDGFEVLHTVKGDDALRNIPVLVLTNLGQREDVERCMELGAAGYVIKAHALPHEIVQRIKDILDPK